MDEQFAVLMFFADLSAVFTASRAGRVGSPVGPSQRL